jgi:hypothetical protein
MRESLPERPTAARLLDEVAVNSSAKQLTN